MRVLRHSSSSPSNFPFLEIGEDALYILVRVQPNASKDELVVGDSKESLKIRLTKAPVDGEANRALIKVLSKFLKIKKSSIKITSGKKSRNKRLKIIGVEPREIEAALKKIVD